MRMEEERKARQKYVEGSEDFGSGRRRQLEHQTDDRDKRKSDTLEQKDKEREADAIRVS